MKNMNGLLIPHSQKFFSTHFIYTNNLIIRKSVKSTKYFLWCLIINMQQMNYYKLYSPIKNNFYEVQNAIQQRPWEIINSKYTSLGQYWKQKFEITFLGLFKKIRVKNHDETYSTHALDFFMDYSNLFPSTFLLIMDFKYPQFSICIQFCQVYYLVFVFPRFLFTQVKNWWLQHCRRHSCNGFQIFHKALISPTSAHQEYNFLSWWTTAV
jgi:hypothetical protein